MNTDCAHCGHTFDTSDNLAACPKCAQLFEPSRAVTPVRVRVTESQALGGKIIALFGGIVIVIGVLLLAIPLLGVLVIICGVLIARFGAAKIDGK